MTASKTGPLAGRVVLEMGGIGPGPYAGMLLADMGADVIRIDRPGASSPLPIPDEHQIIHRGKRRMILDLKHDLSRVVLQQLIEGADVLIEGNRPGVAERLGFGPDVCAEIRPSLVYGRMTGWGQTGPWAQMAGHDINYISVTGALDAIGDAGGPPQVPLNLLGDYGAGATFLVMGVLAALLEVERGGEGQVVDAAIVDGASHLLSPLLGFVNAGTWSSTRGTNDLDGGAPYYRVYETADARFMAVGAIEPPFFRALLDGLGIDEDIGRQTDRSSWPDMAARIGATFLTRTQAEWCAVFDGSDACTTPVLTFAEAPFHAHVKARGSLSEVGGIRSAAAPRLTGTPSGVAWPPRRAGEDTVEILNELQIDAGPLLAASAAAGPGGPADQT